MREATKTLVSVQQPRDRWFRSPLLRARENQYRLLRLAYLSGRPFGARLSRRYLPGSYLAQGSLPRVFRIRHFGALGIWPPAAWRHSRPAKGHPKMRRLPTTHHDRNADWQAPRRVEFPRTPMDTSFATQLQATLNLIPAHTWYAAPSGGLTFINKRSADYLHLAEDHPLRLGTATGAAWDSHVAMLHPDDRDETRRVWANCLRTGSPGEVTFRVRTPQGTYGWRLSRAEPIRADDGTVLYWIGINFDIETLKQVEFYLAEGQRLAHMGCWALNNGTFEHWSPELFKIHGLSPGRSAPSISEYLTLVHPEDREFAAEAIHKMSAEHRGFDFTKRIVRPDGAVRHIRCVGVPVTDAGTFQGFVGTGIDVTEQEELTRARRKSEQELRQILDFAPQLVTVFGPARDRLYANRTALAYFGASLEEWRQRACGTEVHPDDTDRLDAFAARASSSAAPYELEVRLRNSEGNYRWHLARYNPVRDDEGQILRWYVACTDIDDRRRAEERLHQENVALREEIDKTSMFEEIVGASPALTAVLARVSKVAGSDSTVLITGETGTGKELVARAIQRLSPRAPRAFVAVNCAGVTLDLIASELFGHEKGAFTGAIQRHLGRFELAHGGTIFLDEVGELSPDIQVSRLRVLQEREFERVGGRERIQVDVRVIAATNPDLSAGVTDGIFRHDLFYRLNVFPVHMPALRGRLEDIPMLVEYFIGRYARRAGKTFRRVSKRTLDRLQSYPWPGNVRELQNIIERSVIVSDAHEFAVDESWLSAGPGIKSRAGLSSSLAAHEKAIIEDSLRESGGRAVWDSPAAAPLRRPRLTLDSKIRALKIKKSRFRTRPPKPFLT